MSAHTVLIKVFRKACSLFRYFYTLILSFLWRPWAVFDSPSELFAGQVVLTQRYFSNGLSTYVVHVGFVKYGRIFTERVSNISVIAYRKLIAQLSWQYGNFSQIGDPSKNKIFSLSAPLIARSPVLFDTSVVSLLTGGGGNYNIYHWLYDALPRLKCISEAGCDISRSLVLVPSLAYEFQKQSLACLGLRASQLLSSEDYPHLSAKALWVSSHPNPDDHNIPLWIIDYLRSSFLPLRRLPSYAGSRVYIARGDAVNSRNLCNEKDLLCRLSAHGFQSIQLSDYSFVEQVGIFANAKMIVASHGAGLAHLPFCSSGVNVVELFSDVHAPQMYQSISTTLGLQYSSLTGSTQGFSGPPHVRGFVLSSGQIDLILELLGLS